MAAYGLSAADYEDEFPPVLIWPGNERAFNLWCLIGNQWRMGMAGPEALDQMPLRHELDRMQLERDDYDELLACIRIMEAAALGAMKA